MKKRLIGTLLMGALFVSSTSVFVSCKDYDDDINNIVATKADKTELQQVKTALENEISSLKTQLSAIEGQITTLTNNKANKLPDGSDLVDVWNTLKPLLEKTSNLEASIAQAESAIANINSLLGGKLEGDLTGKTYKEALELTFAKVAAVSADLTTQMAKIEGLEDALNNPTTGLKAVVADLQSQVSALDAYKAKVDAIQGDYLKAADKTELLNKIDALKTELQGKIDGLNTTLTAAIATAKSEANTYADGKASAALDAAKSYTNAELEKVGITITSLTNDMQTLSGKVDEAAALANNLNVYVRQALRGLVFNMDSFYQGVEATDITVLYFRKYTLNAADAETPEEWGYNSNTDWTADAKKFADWTKGIIGAIVDVDAAAHKAAAAQAAVNYEEHKHIPAEVLKTTRYAYTTATRVLQFRAKYFMNPSSAKVDNEAGTVKVVATDKPFHSSIEWTDTLQKDVEFNGKTTDYCAGIKVKDWKTDNGMLIVDYDCTDPDKIRQISKDDAITVFATQVQVANDTTITSDFAAVYKQDVKDIRIAHTLSSAAARWHYDADTKTSSYYHSHAADLVNTHCGYCALEDANHEYHAGLHLMQTVGEAAGIGNSQNKPSDDGGFAPQDEVGYTDSLNLNKLVEVHYTVYDPNGQNATHLLMSADEMKEKFGLHFEFELTGLYYGSNETSESAHAAIKQMPDPMNANETIYMLRPQMPDSVLEGNHYIGHAAPWDYEGHEPKGKVGKQDRQTIGRTPIVRVKLIDNDGNVVDYGYIRIKVVEYAQDVKPVITSINYNAGEMTASQAFCGDLGGNEFDWTQTWAEMEYDIHHYIGVTQNEFESDYEPDYVEGNIFRQFYLSPVTKVLTVCPAAVDDATREHAYDVLGAISYLRNVLDEQTSVINWHVTPAKLKEYADRIGGDATKAYLVRYVRFNKKAGSTISGPSTIWVSITPSGLKITKDPAVTGKVVWNNEFSKKNATNWYITNGNPAADGKIPYGYDEIHANTISPEDELSADWTGLANVMDTYLPEVFTKSTNAAGQPNKLVTPTNDGYNAFIKLSDGAKIQAKDLKLDLVFTIDDAKHVFKGVIEDGEIVEYGTKVKDGNAKVLQAWKEVTINGKYDPATETLEDIAELVYDGTDCTANPKDSINHYTVNYINYNTNPGDQQKAVDALLNYKAHNELADDVIKAVVAVKAKYLTCDVPLTDNTIDIRFLRPINVFSNDAEVGDAYDTGIQYIYLRDLVSFTDWRDVAFIAPYWNYYQIKFIEINGVVQGEPISRNAAVLTDMDNEATPVSLQKKNQLLDFKYTYKPTTPVCKYDKVEDYGYLTYSNNSQITRDFHIWLPIKVHYEWGNIYTTVKVLIHATQGNQGARQN